MNEEVASLHSFWFLSFFSPEVISQEDVARLFKGLGDSLLIPYGGLGGAGSSGEVGALRSLAS